MPCCCGGEVKEQVRRLSMRPYPCGEVWVCKSMKVLKREFEAITKEKWSHEKPSEGLCVTVNNNGECVYLVYAPRVSILAHELSHAILDAFDHIGSDPRDGNGEPFCYMLSTLMEEATK